MSRFDNEPMPYTKLSENLKIVRDRYGFLYILFKNFSCN